MTDTAALTDAEREALGRVVDKVEADEQSLNEWHPCRECPNLGPCPCSGRSWLGPDLAAAVANILAARQATEHDECAALMEAAADRIEAVGALHAPVRMYPEFRFKPWCGECSQGFTAGGDDPPSARRVAWPCATARAAGMTDPLADTGSAS